jgi:hypothetical protein
VFSKCVALPSSLCPTHLDPAAVRLVVKYLILAAVDAAYPETPPVSFSPAAHYLPDHESAAVDEERPRFLLSSIAGVTLNLDVCHRRLL